MVKCTTIVVGEEEIIPYFKLLVNGKLGDVAVDLNTDVVLRIEGADPNDDCLIANISTFPDTTLCEGDSDNTGVFECTVRFNEDAIIEIQGFEDCWLGKCNKKTNIVKVIAGKGAKKIDWSTTILYGVAILGGILGGAYVLGSLLKGRD